jgi:NADPH-dependent 2,4-dienoyl-CoA reductase/sulfur reductase-like enzyme
VVGGGAAGARAAQVLAQGGEFAETVVISAEQAAPYYRPALSKQVMAGEWTAQRAGLPRKDVDGLVWRGGVAAVGLDARERVLTLDDGSTLDADAIVLACGCRPRELPGVPSGGRVRYVARIQDAVTIEQRLRGCGSLVVVGGGLIGSEVASVAAKAGVPTTVVDPAPAPLRRALGPLGDAFAMRRHRERGIELRLGVGVTSVDANAERVRIGLSDGTGLVADLVVVAVGVVPDTDWLAAGGTPLGADGAIVCDATLTADGLPWLMAAGDAASWWSRQHEAQVRVEHWFTALEHGALAGASLALDPADRPPFTAEPFFWTEQHSAMVHFVGTHGPDSGWEIVEGDRESGVFVASAATSGHTTGYLLVDSARRLGVYRKLMRELAASA